MKREPSQDELAEHAGQLLEKSAGDERLLYQLGADKITWDYFVGRLEHLWKQANINAPYQITEDEPEGLDEWRVG